MTPARWKSRVFRVATVRPWTRAVAAIMLSLIGMACPAARKSARILAQRRPVAASRGRLVNSGVQMRLSSESGDARPDDLARLGRLAPGVQDRDLTAQFVETDHRFGSAALSRQPCDPWERRRRWSGWRVGRIKARLTQSMAQRPKFRLVETRSNRPHRTCRLDGRPPSALSPHVWRPGGRAHRDSR